MTEKGCDNCYYSYFDERAYPCSLCIRGIERTDMWQPSKKTKVDRKTEPQTEDKCKGCIYENDQSLMACVSCEGKVPYDGYDFMDEPQTDCPWK